MKQLKVGNLTLKSIWKTDDESKNKRENDTYSRHRTQAYCDPTADAAIGNIMREERNKQQKKQKSYSKDS